MTTGNSAAMTVSVAKMAPPDLGNNPCAALKLKNETEREQAVAGLKDDPGSAPARSALAKAEGGGMTFASASVSLGSGSGVLSGCSNGKAKERTRGSLVEGGTSDMKNGKAPVLCPEADYQHAAGGAGAHAEAKIFNELSSTGRITGGTVTLNIDWRYRQPDGGTYKSGMPCINCYRMMCAAKKCGITILLCDDKDEPQPLDPDGNCDQVDEDPDRTPYQRLDERLGEHPYFGRGPV